MKTIIAAFTDSGSADQAIAYLRSRGVTNAQIYGGDIDGATRLSTFTALNVPDDKAQLYAEAIRRGAVIVTAQTEGDAKEMANELDRMGSIDLDAADKRWRKSGWSGYDSNAPRFDAQAYATERTELLRDSTDADDRFDASTRGTEERDLEVVEERVNIGKREVSRGGVRVRTFVLERPVSEQVELREERVDVRRERVDEPVSAGTLDTTLDEDEFVVTARGEEAVVGKEARVVERVHVGKTAETRTETIEETERRRDVEVEQLADEGPVGRPHEPRR